MYDYIVIVLFTRVNNTRLTKIYEIRVVIDMLFVS